jgi:BirA family biotin operon repressor/biotin-[acetyl-CoA-carboxylase] ligase
MRDGLEDLLDLLADGERHTGVRLAEALGITRAAVWKRIEALRVLGLAIESGARGYRLDRPFRPLDATAIRSALEDPRLPLEIRFLVDSSNTQLALSRRPEHRAQVLLAEAQSAGRGRRGRAWRSPPGSGIYLSLAWRFESGLAAASVLRELGADSVGLKWPNDLWAGEAKLGGILIDISGTAEGPCEAIIGLGLNVDLGLADGIDQAWTDLTRLGLDMDRNVLAAALINRLIEFCARFDRQGFAQFASLWRQFDLLHGRGVRVESARGPATEGRADGVDEQGRLALVTEAGRGWISQGELSVRPG